MADNRITLDVGGKFNGEFLDNLNKGINTSKKEMGSAKAGLGALMGAMNEISPAAANAVGGVKNLVGAFAAGGIVGGAIELAVRGIGEGVKFVTKHLEEAKERATAFAQILRDDIIGAASSANDNFANLRQTMADTAKEADAVVSALNGEVAQTAQAEIYQLHIDTLNKITDDMDASARAVLLAQESVAAAEIKQAAAIEIATNNRNAAAEKLTAAETRQKEAAEAVASIEKTRASYEQQNIKVLKEREKLEYFSNATTDELTAQGISYAKALEIVRDGKLNLAKFDEEHKDVMAGLNEITKQQAEASKRLAATEKEVADAKRADAAAELNLSSKTLEAKSSLADAQRKLTDAENAIEKAERDRLDAEGDLMVAEMEQMLAAKEAAKREAKLNEAKEKREKAELEAAEMTEKENKDSKDGKGGKGGNGGAGGNAVANVRMDAGQMGNLLAQMIGVKNFDAVKQTVKTVHDVQKEEYNIQRARRVQENKLMPELTHYYSLMRKPENFLSDFDKRWMKSYQEGVLPGLVKELGPERMKELTQEASKKMLDSSTMLNKTTAEIKKIISDCTMK